MANALKTNSVACKLAIALLMSAAGTAVAQNCSNGINPAQCTPVGNCLGPDVIVGDLTTIQNYTGTATLDALSVGTYSCNIGNALINWIDSTAEHPVISQSFFKFKIAANNTTTYEQLGQSWLKHGFFALSDTLCCTGCQATDGTHLGIHCSDPYTGSRNGSQSGLGPKWQVNAATGVFTYPPANPTFSGQVARRLQVKVTDLEASTAQTVAYYVAGQYVTHDDATAGNKYNNESYRNVAVTGSGAAWTFTVSGSTQRTQQGIRAWADRVDVLRNAPNNLPLAPVSESDVFISGDGLVIVASQATNISGGQWHYEYAIQNMNSDRSVGGVSVPVPAGVTITNIGFHDVDYHDGDGIGNVNFSGTDWLASMANGSVSTGDIHWNTEAFATNQSANAIRWGNTFNFRFDANVAPLVGGAGLTLTLFKTGTTVVTSRLDVPGNPPPPVCPCDYNHTGGLNSQDFFDFLGDLLNNAGGADWNHDGVINSQDLFDFLGCFLAPPAGC